jgi:hypothetical protein
MTAVSRCPACGAFVQKADRFCWSCGSDLGAAGEPVRRDPAQPMPESDRGAELLVRRAHLAWQRGEMEQAERFLREALERDAENVSGLSMLSEVLRAKGDLVGAVAAAQQATEVGGAEGTTPGALARAREARAQIEAGVVRELTGRAGAAEASPLDVLASPGDRWYRSRRCYFVLAVMGAATLFLALVALLKGQTLGYVWFGSSILAAGWCYQDAETRRAGGLFWGPFVLFLGPFGLAIYLLARY